MGAWGTGIFDDDTTCDVKDGFIDYIEEGLSSKKAATIILDEYLEEFHPEEDFEVMSLVYIGLAAVQLENNCLVEDVRHLAIQSIDRGADLELWEEADEDDYLARKKELEELKQKLLEVG
ncbi:DUF4259 domain-containing protein [Planococcus shenhongbingii]|uniref:DUF4259 domain-containing protein n=1 Tax=Planococcus shenhongbingii TaxID=3058398 RepID=A0ABT8NAB4_9BACL|nr:DUF4259 domain-containing protein [Planococcus sp. N017]MDN7244703.1 DUF4259 domain-containing protein [Planococcus sp. N017]